ncbi:outer membrane beta-barrel protein [Flavobacterium sp. DG1-102-2]|uniref:outer membrane beta-barrel protein n=1 Tax=Flavobacterium sp. DG1-102-2 TaxID=3081663 RepID=UPI0029493C1F|nr:outer membrane beta-barrel protein [Flavobacterium sp. DG1-102-2]MDV6167473.1 outer membrane beta-barrel protein [Flavobacterium sp. DG1-102-2]
MKKALFLFMLTLPLLAIAQNKVKFGINTGAVLSDVRGESYAANFNYGMGYLVGFSMETRLSERLSFSANINYERKNPTKKEDYSYMIIVAGQNGMAQEIMIDGTAKITNILNYISIPVNLKYYIGSNKGYFVTIGLFAIHLIMGLTLVLAKK